MMRALIFAMLLALPALGQGHYEEEILYPSHTCEHGNWYAANSDENSVTVHCWVPEDPPDLSIASNSFDTRPTLPRPQPLAPTCTEPWGRPCASWIRSLVGEFPPAEHFDLDQAQERRTRFWTIKPRRGNRQVLRSKTFWISGAMLTGAMLASGEHVRSEAPAVAGALVSEYACYRGVGAPIGLGIPAWGIAHYIRSGLR